MKSWAKTAGSLLLVAVVAGCATQKEGVPVEDQTMGGPGAAETRGVGGAAGPEGAALSKEQAELLAKHQVYFPFDSTSIDGEGRAIVEAHAAFLATHPEKRVTLEGHCDERGTREYNLALGERRAQAVERLVRILGIADNRVKMVSYGEERPVALGHDESAWRLNRRVEIIY